MACLSSTVSREGYTGLHYEDTESSERPFDDFDDLCVIAPSISIEKEYEMSVIIRLQNLPWAANAADIRTYFHGLSIPEGGVHIVGGEQGDAFIAFSTDEDARQAMQRDGGKLKEVKIKLMLSSRTEMMKIIEQARQQSVTLQQLIHQQQNTPAVTTVTHSNSPAAQAVAAAAAATPTSQPQDNGPLQSPNGSTSMDTAKSVKEDFVRVKERSRRSRSRSRGRERDRSRSRERSRDRNRRSSRRGRDRSRSRDRYRRRSRSKDRFRRDRSRERNENRGQDMRGSDRRQSRENRDHNMEEMKREVEEHAVVEQGPVIKKPLLPDPPATTRELMQKSNEVQQSDGTVPVSADQQPSMGFMPDFPMMAGFPGHMAMMGPRGPMPGVPPPPMYPTMALPMGAIPPMNFPRAPMTPADMAAMAALAQANPMMPPLMAPYVPSIVKPEVVDSDTCTEVHGLPSSINYADIKKLFENIPISPDGIKIINDNHGKRTGIAYVKFMAPNFKQVALEKSGQKVRGSEVEVINLKESIFNSAVDNFQPGQELKNNNGVSDNERGSEKPAIKFQDPRLMNKSNLSGASPPRMSPKSQRYQIDNVFVQGLPTKMAERDIYNFFSEGDVSPIHIHVFTDGNGTSTGEAFCQFESPQEAEKAVSIRNNSMIGRWSVSVRLMSKEEYDKKISRPAPLMETPDSRVDPRRTYRNDKEKQRGEPRMVDPRSDRVKGEGRGDYSGDPRADRGDPRMESRRGDHRMDSRGGGDHNRMDPRGGGDHNRMDPRGGGDHSRIDPRGGGDHRMDPRGGGDHRMEVRGGGDHSRMDLRGSGDHSRMDSRGDHNRMDPRGVGDHNRMDPRGGGDHRMDMRGNDHRMDVNMDIPGPRILGPRPLMDQGGMGMRSDRGFPRGGGGMFLRGVQNFHNNDDDNEGNGSGYNEWSVRGRGGGPFRGRGRGRGASGSFEHGGIRRPPPPTYIDNEHVEKFGQPGCVIGLENIHFGASVDDIVGFCSDFNIHHHDIIRRFDDLGRPTGDARVALSSPEDATKAVETLNRTTMCGRTIRVFRIE